jgi:hypothetical protein
MCHARVERTNHIAHERFSPLVGSGRGRPPLNRPHVASSASRSQGLPVPSLHAVEARLDDGLVARGGGRRIRLREERSSSRHEQREEQQSTHHTSIGTALGRHRESPVCRMPDRLHDGSQATWRPIPEQKRVLGERPHARPRQSRHTACRPPAVRAAVRRALSTVDLNVFSGVRIEPASSASRNASKM